MANQRRVRAANTVGTEGEGEFEPMEFEEVEIIQTDETSWIRVGDTFVDTSRIISVGPLESIWDEEQGKEGITKPEGGVAIQIDSPHPDSQFIQEESETVEDIMSRIVEATTD